MIFQHTYKAVLSGAKTQTRRLQREGDVEVLDDNDEVAVVRPAGPGRMRYSVGQSIAVQPGRGEGAVARVRLTRIRRERVQSITEADAVAEGFEADAFGTARDKFEAKWHEIHGPKSWGENPWVYVLTFELLQDTANA